MKTGKQNETETQNEQRKRFATVNPELNKYQGKVLFPEKLALAEERLKNLEIPEFKKKHD